MNQGIRLQGGIHLRRGTEAGEFTSQQPELTGRFVRGIIAESMKLLSSDPDLVVENDALEAILRLLQ